MMRERRNRMIETDRIKNALVNVITMATHSDYYKKDRDDEDIDLIRAIVKKEIPKKPYFESDGYADGYPVYDKWICPRCGHNYEVDSDKFDYCPKCGQRIDWSDEK